MLLAIAGITGVGKSFFAEEISKELGFNKVHTIRTREMRPGEQNGKTGLFMSKEELEKMKKQGQIIYDFEVFGGMYAYKKDEILSEKNYVFEMHYTTIKDWKKIRPDIITIYLIPKDVNIALTKIKERNLGKEKEQERTEEIKEQYKEFMTNKTLQNMFDYIIYNDYTEKTRNEVIELVKNTINNGEKSMKDIFFKENEDFENIIKNTLKDKKIEKLNQITTGWTNIVYEVETDNGNYFFRFPRDEFWSRTIVKDCEFANYIYKKTEFNTSDLHLYYNNGRPFSVHKKIEGTPLAKKMDNMTDSEIKGVGNDIAKFMYELHNVDFEEKNVFNTANIGLKLPDFLNELLTLHVSEEDRKFWQINKINNKCPNLVHGDLNPSNVLIDNNNKVTAIIDFGFGGFGDKYDDLSRIIGRCPEKFKKAIVESYENYSNNKINMEILDTKIQTWDNIDKGYINYMRSIGIYE